MPTGTCKNTPLYTNTQIMITRELNRFNTPTPAWTTNTLFDTALTIDKSMANSTLANPVSRGVYMRFFTIVLADFQADNKCTIDPNHVGLGWLEQNKDKNWCYVIQALEAEMT